MVGAGSGSGGGFGPGVVEGEMVLDRRRVILADGKVLGGSTGLELGIEEIDGDLLEGRWVAGFWRKWEGLQIVGHPVAWQSLATAWECRPRGLRGGF